ncbi:AfsR/SARP family transcriptional regulator [Plantactinospora sonchi]|uniref:BTAD domain-containing putative transcriptional regulator n=1 Tax=Plantactinospora sonchi TaxID=1544735 RepID=A0ABU7RP06_9ACTN
MVLFHVLGPIEVHSRPGHRLGAGKPARVLATLLSQPNAWVTVDQLRETTWQEQDAPESAEANLKTYVWRLRRILPGFADGPRIESRPGAYRLRVGAGELDADLATDLAARARTGFADGDAGAALALVDAALRLWRGRPFAGFDPASAATVARLDELHLDLQEQRAELLVALGRAGEAVEVLRAVTTTAPLREAAWARLVGVLHLTGARPAALAAYRQARQVLTAELGVEPGPALAEAYRRAVGGVRDVTPRRELPRNVPLTGRADELETLLRAVAGPAPLVLVDGMVGVGRTAFVVHAAHRLAARCPDGQFFVRLGADLPAGPATGVRAVETGPGGPAAVLGRLLRGLGVPGPELPADLDGRSALWRSELAGQRVLLVLDDVPDGTNLAPLLPAGPGCLTLVTTRNRNWHPDAATRVSLPPLDSGAAAALFRSALGDRAGDIDPAAVAAVVGYCGGLPAALRDAAARLRTRPRWTADRLVEELDDDPCLVLSDTLRRSVGAVRDRLTDAELATWHALTGLPDEFGRAAAARATGLPADLAGTALETLVDRGLLEAVSVDAYRSQPLLRHLAGCTGRTERRTATACPAGASRELRPTRRRVA